MCQGTGGKEKFKKGRRSMEIKDLLKILALISIFTAFVYGFINPIKSASFVFIYIVCGISDMTITHNKVQKLND